MKNQNSRTMRDNAITYALVIAAYAGMEIWMHVGKVSSSLTGLLVPFCYYAILAVSLNLVVGILGELSLGHAGFMCVGAFTSAFFSVSVGDAIPNSTLRFVIAILIAIASAALFGFLIGIPVLRLRGDYLAIVTLAFGEIIKNVINSFFIGKDSRGFHVAMKDSLSLGLESGGTVLLNGPQGISKVPRDSNFTIGIILLLITLFIVLRLIQSRDGRAIMAIRDNQIAAESIGISLTKYKLAAFTISAAMAGGAGALYAHNYATLSATPKNFGYNMSIMILVYVVLGGIGNIRGSLIAPIVLNLVLDYFLRKFQMLGDSKILSFLSDNRMLIYAIILIVMMIVTWSPKLVAAREELLAGRRRKEED